MSKLADKINIDEKYSQIIPCNRAFVLGEGNVDSPIVFIGEAPGGEEEKLLHPFVGKAGKNLNEFLDEIHLLRQDVYITNAVKFRPTKENSATKRESNRTPTTAEILLYRDWLIEELKVISPKLVVTLGNTPLFSLTGDKELKITACHGQLLEHSLDSVSFKLMPFYHPAAIIYRRELAEVFRQDMQQLGRIYAQLDV